MKGFYDLLCSPFWPEIGSFCGTNHHIKLFKLKPLPVYWSLRTEINIQIWFQNLFCFAPQWLVEFIWRKELAVIMTFPRKKEKNIFDQIGTYLFSRVFLLITKTFFSKLPCKFVKHFDVDIYVTTQNGKMHQLYELSEREKFCLNFSGCNQHLAIAHGQIVFEIKFFLVLNLFCSGVTRGWAR